MTSPDRYFATPSVLLQTVLPRWKAFLVVTLSMVTPWVLAPASLAQEAVGTNVASPDQHEATPVGGEFQVNTSIDLYQFTPSVDADGSGNFVVTWSSFESTGTDSDGASIQIQRYRADGTPVGTETQVNTETSAQQNLSVVAVAPDGRFVVVWQSEVPPGGATDPWTVEGQRFDADGTPSGGQFQVNTMDSTLYPFPAVAIAPSGDFVVVWRGDASGGFGDTSDIRGQRFAADGTPVGAELEVNATTAGYQSRPDIAMDRDGSFVVVWHSTTSAGDDSDGYSVQARRFAADGTPVGTDFQVNTFTTSYQRYPAVAADPRGGFLVAWESFGSSGDDTSFESIQVQRFDGTGVPVGGELQVNSTTVGGQYLADVSVEPTGAFVVTWASDGSSGNDTSGASIQARRFDVTGSATGAEFQVNTYTTSAQIYPAPALTSAGNFVVIWQSQGSSGSDFDTLSIQGQRFVLDSFLFADGFESGDTTAWSDGS